MKVITLLRVLFFTVGFIAFVVLLVNRDKSKRVTWIATAVFCASALSLTVVPFRPESPRKLLTMLVVIAFSVGWYWILMRLHHMRPIVGNVGSAISVLLAIALICSDVIPSESIIEGIPFALGPACGAYWGTLSNRKKREAQQETP